METTYNFYILTTFYNRNIVESLPGYIYLFSDNLARTSGSNPIRTPIGKKQLTDLYTGKKFPNKTQATIRGLRNAYPITTRKSTTEDFTSVLEFEDVLMQDCKRIKSDVRTNIVVPSGGFGTGKAFMEKRFAEVMQRVLLSELGLNTVIIQCTHGGYGVVPDDKVYPRYSRLSSNSIVTNKT